MSLHIIEGSFAGVAGDFIIVEGVDLSEGLLEFQVFSAETGKEVFKSYHQPNEEFSVFKRGTRSSLTFFAKATVRCELALEGQECWKKILGANKVLKPTPMPDCTSIFAKAKTELTELALVTLAARVANLDQPKLEFIGGGHATCAPAP